MCLLSAEGYTDLWWTLYTAHQHISRTVDTDRDSEKGESLSFLNEEFWN